MTVSTKWIRTLRKPILLSTITSATQLITTHGGANRRASPGLRPTVIQKVTLGNLTIALCPTAPVPNKAASSDPNPVGLQPHKPQSIHLVSRALFTDHPVALPQDPEPLLLGFLPLFDLSKKKKKNKKKGVTTTKGWI